METSYIDLIKRIIQGQEQVIGPLAAINAKKVLGLHILGQEITTEGNGKQILEDLVNQYAKLFGKASIELCRESILPILDKISPNDIPEILK